MNHICFSAWYDERTGGALYFLKTFVNGLLSIIFKALGVTYSETGIFCERAVNTARLSKQKHPPAKTSSINPSTSSSVSPSPTMIPVLATTPRSAIRRKTDKLTSYLAALRTCGLIRRTVSILWEIISRRRIHDLINQIQSSLKIRHRLPRSFEDPLDRTDRIYPMRSA